MTIRPRRFGPPATSGGASGMRVIACTPSTSRTASTGKLDTNTVERAIRPLCLSRKNAFFASGDDGGARWAAVASLVETCKLNGVDPQRYFTDLLTRLVDGWPNSRIDELMPWCWATDEKG